MTEFIQDIIKSVWNGETVEVTLEQYNTIPSDVISNEGIVVSFENDKALLSSKNRAPVRPRMGHKYEMPPFADNVRALLKRALDGVKSCNIMLYGPMGTGKTEFVNEIAREMGFKVFHVTGVEEKGEDAFYGHMVCKIDKTIGQNYTPFEKGPLYRAFIEGTELDANGDQILYDEQGNVTTDPSGMPRVVGRPAIFFLDEFAALRPEVFLGVFNRALEIPRNGSRSIEITAENGKTIKSHPSMVMFFAGNTSGVGNSGKYQFGYTAQSNRMDASTLNRMVARFEFGYNLKAEDAIARGALNNDLEADRLMAMAKSLRELYLNEKVETLFSTRNIVSITDAAQAYRAMGGGRWMVDAIRDSVFNGLPEGDKTAWNEVIRALWNVDLIQESIDAKSKDYFFI